MSHEAAGGTPEREGQGGQSQETARVGGTCIENPREKEKPEAAGTLGGRGEGSWTRGDR